MLLGPGTYTSDTEASGARSSVHAGAQNTDNTATGVQLGFCSEAEQPLPAVLTKC